MAELSERLEEMESRPPPQTPTVSEGGFATVFDIPLFAQLNESQRECFSTGTEIHLKAGETLIRDGDPADVFYIMLEGGLRVTEYYGDQEIFLAEVIPGAFFSEIEILLDVPHSVLTRAVADSRLFRLPRARFWDLLRCSPLVAREIMRTLATRLRNYESYSQEREKLIQLGTMAAGLAHELNNPATAARRAANDLRQSVEKVQDYACELNETLSAEQWKQLVAASQEAVHCATSQLKLNSLEQSDREEAIERWLDSNRIADAWDLAPALVNARVDEGDLETVKRTVPAQDLGNAIQWLAANLTTRDLLKSITHSTERISELVRAVKSYSFMDQAPWQEIDVHEGIENTLIILGHKLRNVTVTRDFDRTLPRLCAYGGELNQVWTNLIDNAIYAVPEGRESAQSWRELLVGLKAHGLAIAPELAIRRWRARLLEGAGRGLPATRRRALFRSVEALRCPRYSSGIRSGQRRQDLREDLAGARPLTARRRSPAFEPSIAEVRAGGRLPDSRIARRCSPSTTSARLGPSALLGSRSRRRFSACGIRTVRTRGCPVAGNRQLIVFKLVMAAAKTWRRLKADGLPKVIEACGSRTALRSPPPDTQDAA